MQKRRIPLRNFLLKELYQNYRVVRMSNKANRFLKGLFREYRNNPKQLPPEFQRRLTRSSGERGLRQLICDYIAGMTDRYFVEILKNLIVPEIILTTMSEFNNGFVNE